MAISSIWWDDPQNPTVEIRRLSETVVNHVTSTVWDSIYAALPAVIEGRPSNLESTIMGEFGLSRYRLTFREEDMTFPSPGWPREKDAVRFSDGREFEIVEMEDHSMRPNFFTLQKHQVAILGEEILTST